MREEDKLLGTAMASGDSAYSGAEVALLTLHGKERVIAPVLEGALGCRVRHESGYNTDLLGTFTRDIPRAGMQLEAARKKARIGMQLSGLPLGLASEGSFGADPFAGMFPWNMEFLIFIDDERELEVVGIAQGAANLSHLLAEDWAAVEVYAKQAGFAEHHLVVRPEGEDDPRMRKGIASWAELEAAFAWALAASGNGRVFVENDVRAHANPTRMANIRLAAQDLVNKMGSHCPACDTIGYWPVEHVPGLTCEACGLPTRQTRAEIWGCIKCGYRESKPVAGPGRAEPSHCGYCNP